MLKTLIDASSIAAKWILIKNANRLATATCRTTCSPLSCLPCLLINFYLKFIKQTVQDNKLWATKTGPPQQLRPWNQHKKSFVYNIFRLLWFVIFSALFETFFFKQILHSCCGFTLVSECFPEKYAKYVALEEEFFTGKCCPSTFSPLVIRIHLSKQPCLLSGLFFCCSTHFCLHFYVTCCSWKKKRYTGKKYGEYCSSSIKYCSAY